MADPAVTPSADAAPPPPPPPLSSSSSSASSCDDDVANSVASKLRAVFQSGLTLPISWRIAQLRSLLLLLTEREADLCGALASDLSKTPYECYFSEFYYLKNSCIYAIKNLKKWAAPQKVPTPLLSRPSWAEVVAEPLGVILVISPWNYPLTLALDPVIGAIAAGNAVVLKPSEVAPATSSLLAKLLPEYLDSNAIAVVEGGVSICTALLEQKWDKIFFTGNATVGKIIMTAATKHLTPVILELGGKCPVLIDSTADLDVTVKRLAFAKWNSSYGQACVAPDYVLVENSIAQDLIAKLKKTLVKFYGEDASTSVDHARVVNARHIDRLRRYLEEDSVKGTIVHGGDVDKNSLYFGPTILLNPSLESSVMEEEIFGPILPIIEVESMDDALRFVNARPKPLSIYVFTEDDAFKKKAAMVLQTGSIVYNDAVVQFVLDGLPFGGVGESGFGAYHGKYTFDAFSHPKTLVYRRFCFDAPFRYPPFIELKVNLCKCLMNNNYLGAILALLGLKKRA